MALSQPQISSEPTNPAHFYMQLDCWVPSIWVWVTRSQNALPLEERGSFYQPFFCGKRAFSSHTNIKHDTNTQSAGVWQTPTPGSENRSDISQKYVIRTSASKPVRFPDIGIKTVLLRPSAARVRFPNIGIKTVLLRYSQYTESR
jgi:hypothetical protein